MTHMSSWVRVNIDVMSDVCTCVALTQAMLIDTQSDLFVFVVSAAVVIDPFRIVIDQLAVKIIGVVVAALTDL